MKIFSIILLMLLIMLMSSCRYTRTGEVEYSKDRAPFVTPECDKPKKCKKFRNLLRGARPAYIQNVTMNSAYVVMRTKTKSRSSCFGSKPYFIIKKVVFDKKGKEFISRVKPKIVIKNLWYPTSRIGDGGMPRCETLVKVDGLTPDTTYRYEAGFINGKVLAKNAQFMTPPQIGNKDKEVHFFAVGDFGPSKRSFFGVPRKPRNLFYAVNNVLQKVTQLEPMHFGVLLGDLDNSEDGKYWSMDHHFFGVLNAYATPKDLKKLKVKGTFNNKEGYYSMMSGVPLYITPGNHDCRAWGHRGHAQPIYDNFVMPTNNNPCLVYGGCGKKDPAKNHHPESYFSFDMGNVHMVSLSIIGGYDVGSAPNQTSVFGQKKCSMPDYYTGNVKKHWNNLKKGSTMIRWLKEDLLDTPKDMWKVVYYHAGYGFRGEKSQNKLFKLFKKLGVDLVLFGHKHYYHTGKKKGIRWFLVGSGGYGDNFCDPSHDPSFVRFVVKGNNLLMSRFGFDFKGKDCRPDPYNNKYYKRRKGPPECSGMWCGYRGDFYPTRPRELDRMLISRLKTPGGSSYTTKIESHDFYQWGHSDLAINPEFENPQKFAKSDLWLLKNRGISTDMRCDKSSDCHAQVGLGIEHYCWRPQSALFYQKAGFCIK